MATKKAPKKEEKTTVHCGDCDHENPQGASECEKCGYEL